MIVTAASGPQFASEGVRNPRGFERRWRSCAIAWCAVVLGGALLVPCANAQRIPATGLQPLFGGVPQVPSPAIARVISFGGRAASHGSGTLINVDTEYGYVLTNWHVVRESVDHVVVVFPDGFQSMARVLHMDETWDLALLRIWRPPAAPMPLADRVPQPGEPLTIAGYGPGEYRAAQGNATNYAAPSAGKPFELIDVLVSARQGDSGGPIMNQQGQLAGVLFGTGNGTTTGSHIGRVRTFLAAAADNSPASGGPTDPAPFTQPPAQDPEPREPPPRALASATEPAALPRSSTAAASVSARTTMADPFGDLPSLPEDVSSANRNITSPDTVALSPAPADAAPDQPARPEESLAVQDGNRRLPACELQPIPATGDIEEKVSISQLLGSTVWDRVKSIFAVFGLLALAERVLWTKPVAKKKK